MLDEQAIGGGARAHLAVGEGAEQAAEAVDVACRGGEAVEGRRRKLVVRRLARVQHEPGDPLGMGGSGDLRVGAAGVVSDERHLAQLERGERGSDQRTAAGGREVGAGVEREAV